MSNRSPNASATAFLIIGLAAGAAITWVLKEGGKEKLTSGALADLIPKDLVDKATKALQQGRDRLVEAVDEASNSFRA